jgi:acetyl-CoA hydrolase
MAQSLLSQALRQRVRRTSLYNKLVKPETLIPFFKDGMYVGWSGFTGVGYPKIMPVILADHVEREKLQGKLRFNLFVGASTGGETEDRWAALNMIDRRAPHQVGKNIQKGINEGRIRFFDKHLSMFPQDLVYGFYTKDKTTGTPGKLDLTIVEATSITEEGNLVLGASVGATPELIQMSDKIIIEVNTKIPNFEGLHDLGYIDLPPHRKPTLIQRVDDRIGLTSLPIDPEKIIGIVESTKPDNTAPSEPQDEIAATIANHILDFFNHEVKAGRLPPSLLPLQSGIGNIANAIVGGLATGYLTCIVYIYIFIEVIGHL